MIVREYEKDEVTVHKVPLMLMGGIVVIETVFAYPGLGRLIVFSIQNRDLPTLQASILVVAAIYAIANLLADLAYAWLNPRIRYDRSIA